MIYVETEDLLHSCPIWEFMYQPSPRGVSLDMLHFRRVRDIREAWSHKVVQIAAPSSPTVLCPHLFNADQMTYSLWFFRSRRQSTVYWKVIGPDALMAELAAIPGDANPGADRLNLYLCQHEIRGD